MAEPTETHTSAEVLVFEFICPGCGAVIAAMGRLTLTTERRPDEVTCPACDRTYRLRLAPPVDD